VATLVLPILILAVPILDTTLVSVVRLLEGRPIHQGGRDHTSHRLVYHGLSEKRAVVLLAVVSATLGATSLAYTVLDDARITLVGVLITFALLVQFASFLSDVERSTAPRDTGSAFWRTFVVHRRRLIDVVVDFALITAAFVAAYLLRVEGHGTTVERHIATVSLPVIVAARYLCFIPFGLYRGVWRYAGARDAAAVVGAVLTSEFLAFGFLAATRDLSGFPQSIFVIDALICTVLIGASRFWERAAVRGLSSLLGRSDRRRTLIVGAGRGGRSLLRELRETPGEHVVGFVDDDPRLRRRRLQGVPVLGGTDELARVLERARPDTVLVTIPDAGRAVLDAVVGACGKAEVPCRFVRRETDLDPRVVLGSIAE
jgi:UDP-GlcNAc:undecaprenyl-phosphate GlcNAc-1-phosphate transferase